MGADPRKLIDVLKAELKFLESGGYAQRQESTWRAPFIFEDSPSCFRRHSTNDGASCGECALIALVPPEHRKNEVPCRFIPLDDAGETLDSFYRTSTQRELEWAMDKWLRSTISNLEQSANAIKYSSGRQAPTLL